jgi:neutral ceramidase
MKKAIVLAALLICIAVAAAAATERGGYIPKFEEGNRAPYPTFLFDKTPDIMSVAQTPVQPMAGQSVRVGATLRRDEARASMPVAKVELFYSAGSGAWNSFEMIRSDSDPDYYFGYLPPQPGGAKVVYYIRATDTVGSVTTEMPGPVSIGPDGPVNLVGIDDINEDETTVPADIDILRLEMGYDAENLYVRLAVEGKPGKGNPSGAGMYMYFMPVLNLESTTGGMSELLETPILAYAPLLSSYLGVDPQGLFRLSELLKTKKAIDGSDVKLKKGEHDLFFKLNRGALGPNKNGNYEIVALTAAVKSMDGLLPWEASPFISIIARNHEYTVASEQPEPVSFRAGAATAEITPPKGTPLAGYGDRQGAPSEGVHDPLMAQALVLEAGGEKIAFITADFFLPRRKLFEDVAKMVEEKTGIPRGNVLLSGSHSHSSSGGIFPELALLGGNVVPGVYEATRDKIVSAVIEADKKLQPAKVGTGHADLVGLNSNRREGGGPTDPDLRVLRVDDLKGKPIAMLFNYSAHPTVMGGDNRLFSAEYPGATRRELAKIYPGVVGMFANSSLGNSGPSCPGDCGGGFETINKQGQLFAAKIKEIADGIKTEEKLPFSFISQEVLMQPELDMWVTMDAIRIGNAAFVTAPGEPYVEIGFPVKKRAAELGFPICFVMGVTNDGIGYIIPREWYDKRVYEATFAIFGPNEGEFLRDTMISLVDQLVPNKNDVK